MKRLSLSPVITARSPNFFLHAALADSISSLSVLMKNCVSLDINQPSSVLLSTSTGDRNVFVDEPLGDVHIDVMRPKIMIHAAFEELQAFCSCIAPSVLSNLK